MAIETRLQRRSFLAAAAASFGILAAPRISRAAPAEFVLGCNGGASYRNLYKNVLQQFEKQNNVKVIPVFGSSDELLNRVIAEKNNPSMDCVVTFQGGWLVGKAEGVFEKVDYNRIPHIDDIYDFLRDPDGFAPFVNFGAWGIVYNRDTVSKPPKSFKALWDTEYDHKVMVGGVYHWQIHLAAFAQAWAGDQNKIDVAFAKMKDIAPRLAGFYGLSSDTQSKFQQGIADIAPWYSYTAQRVRQLGIPVAFQMPEEGGFVYPSAYQAVKGTQKLDLVEKLIGTFYDPTLQPMIAQEDGFIPSNKKTVIDSALAKELPTTAEVLTCRNWDWALINRDQAAWLTRWNTEIRPLVRG
jgi:putative spermidine/putrescine transport system substrate-binding protein